MKRVSLTLAAITLVAISCSTTPAELQFIGSESPLPDAWPIEFPLAVVIERNPWALVIGADSPRILLFPDGTIIRYDLGENRWPEFTTARLTASELAKARHALGSLESFMALKDFYDLAPNVTDLPTVEIIRSEQSGSKVVRVYGYAAETVATPATFSFKSTQEPDACPEEFNRLYRLLVSMKPTHSISWMPKYLEVIIWPYEYSPEEPLVWPENWPGIDSRWAFQSGDSYSIVLAGDREKELRRFIESRKEKQAVLLAKKKWSISYRPVTPGSRMAREIVEMLEKGT
jgi:hypothetical protein